MIKGINHNAIRVTNMEKAFDLDDEEGKPWINYLKVAEGQFIELFYGGKREYVHHSRNAGSTHVCFEVDDIFEIADRLKNHGIMLDIEPIRGKD
jgi:lactoylglutathione lyase